MRKIIVFDTETTGKYDFRQPHGSEHQPHVVQIAAAAYGEDGVFRAHFSLVVRPDGWFIPESASAIHGITNEFAHDFGVPMAVAMHVFSRFCEGASWFVAHNYQFDCAVLETAFCRVDRPGDNPTNTRNRYCTMLSGAGILKIPGNYGDWKWPKLSELHTHLFGVGFEDAHDAMSDVKACAKCYFEMSKHQTMTP